jgi:ABC-type transport system substrate-binding protein
MYDRMEATFDRKERIRILRDMEELMINEAPIIPLYVYTQHHLHKPYMRDLAINFTDQQPWSKTWIDPNWKRAARETDNEK